MENKILLRDKHVEYIKSLEEEVSIINMRTRSHNYELVGVNMPRLV